MNDEKRALIGRLARSIAAEAECVSGACAVLSDDMVLSMLGDLFMEVAELKEVLEE